MTKPVSGLGKKYVDLWGMRSPAVATACTSLTFVALSSKAAGSRSLRHPIQGFMIILGVEDRLLFLLRRAEVRDDELLEQRHVELGARGRLRGRTMGWLKFSVT